MKIESFKTLLTVVKHNSITEASHELFLTQPAVTKRLKNLENDYGIKIFDREKNRMFLTEEGKLLVKYANRIISVYNESFAALDEQRGLVRGLLKFGVNLTLGIYVIPRFIKLFEDTYPDVRFKMYTDNSENVIKLIYNNEINFGIVGIIPNDSRLVIDPLYKDRLKIVIGSQILFKKKVISWKELEKIPFIGREKGSDIRDTYEKWFNKKSIKITPKMELNNTESIKFSLQCGLGFSILPWCTIEQEIQRGVLQILTVPGFDSVQQFYICYYKGKTFSKVEKIFLNYIFRFVEKGDLVLPSI